MTHKSIFFIFNPWFFVEKSKNITHCFKKYTIFCYNINQSPKYNLNKFDKIFMSFVPVN